MYNEYMKKLYNLFNMALYHLITKHVGVMGLPILLLTTIGAKTGKVRQTPLAWFSSGDDWIIVASAGGSSKNPSWYINLSKNPDKVWIEMKGGKIKVQPTTLSGSEREKTWEMIVQKSPLYARYKNKADREIPIVKLKRE
jgi:deazaflavin-dependent oxidoreductase (nitroreductase family)